MKESLDKVLIVLLLYHMSIADNKLGGIAQLARACGSYPQCPRFESRCRYQQKAQGFCTAPSI